MNVASGRLEDRLKRVQQFAALLGAAGLLGSIFGAWKDPDVLFPAYLTAFIFWLNLSLGAWGLLMVHALVGGEWGVLIGRILEAAARGLGFLGLLFLPLVLGLGTLYPWARTHDVEKHPHLQHLSSYFNAPWFVARSVAYFASWILVARALERLSRKAGQGARIRRERLAAIGLVLYLGTGFFATVDWVYSIDPEWSSSIVGLLAVAAQGLSALVLATSVLGFLSKDPALGGRVTGSLLIDLGNLTLAATLLWCYLAFSQYLIIWSGDLPREARWYVNRTSGGWALWALVLVALQFALPVFLLLFRALKSKGPVLAGIGLVILGTRLLDTFWNILPTFEPGGPRLHWETPAALTGIGGVWVAVFAGALRARPLLPVRPAPALEIGALKGETP